VRHKGCSESHDTPKALGHKGMRSVTVGGTKDHASPSQRVLWMAEGGMRRDVGWSATCAGSGPGYKGGFPPRLGLTMISCVRSFTVGLVIAEVTEPVGSDADNTLEPMTGYPVLASAIAGGSTLTSSSASVSPRSSTGSQPFRRPIIAGWRCHTSRRLNDRCLVSSRPLLIVGAARSGRCLHNEHSKEPARPPNLCRRSLPNTPPSKEPWEINRERQTRDC
jgi:hypothetical protein